MGVAVLEGEDLIFWGVTGFRKQDACKIRTAVQRRVQRLIDTYKSMVVRKQTHAAIAFQR